MDESTAAEPLERGRDLYARREWLAAHDALALADAAGPLAARDLELLATAAHMLGRDDEHLIALERAHRSHLHAGDPVAAARCAFWSGLMLMGRGETGPATGWLARAQRLLEREQRDCAERGYLLLPVVLRHAAAGEFEAAHAAAVAAAEIGQRLGDPDLLALAVHEQGHALLKQGRVEAGLGLLDEAMVAVCAGELSPIVTGLLYCSVIGYCHEVYELGRAREWTNALTRWCAQQPDMVAFTGVCLVHRAEIMQLHGAWGDALQESERAAHRFTQEDDEAAAAQALYQQGELHRLEGSFDAAEDSYRATSRLGREPQPGMSLLRLEQGNGTAAAAAIRRIADETAEPLARARLLPAYVEIMLSVGDPEAAGSACAALEDLALIYASPMLDAMAAQARGAVDLARGDARAALDSLRRALHDWQALDVPYEGARVRELVGRACAALGDEETAALELDAARMVFRRLGAAPDLARVDALETSPARGDAHGLTRRELEVLRLVAAGSSNREIGGSLVISEHTVARHLQNIFAKLGVSSRTAAGAFAFEHDLVGRHSGQD